MVQVSKSQWRVGLAMVLVAFLGATPMIAPTASAGTSLADCPNLTGEGTRDNPWLLWTDADFGCFVPDFSLTPVGGGADAYIGLAADLTWGSYLPLFTHQNAGTLHFDGRGRSITIKDVTGSNGVFNGTFGAQISNLTVRAVNSTLDVGAGWVSGSDTGSTFTNVASNGPIPEEGGGIVGKAVNTTITSSFSNGVIGIAGGGIAGARAVGATVSNTYSTGLIGVGGGGIVGAGSTDVIVSTSSSTGAIGFGAGGIVGSNSTRPTVVNSFSMGAFTSPAGALVGGGATSPATSNSAGYSEGWSDTAANITLTSVGTSWRTCSTNVPYFVGAFYTSNNCGAIRAARITYEGGAMTGANLTAPTANTFSLVNKGSSGPFSFLAIVGDTAKVTMAGTECTDAGKCKVNDLVQGGDGSRRDVTIVSAGTVKVHRYDAWTGWVGEPVSFTVTPVPTPTSSTTTTIAGSGGTPAPTAGVLTVKKGKKLARTRLLKWYKVPVKRGSVVTLRLSGSSRKYCKVVGASIKGVKVGKCKVRVRVAPKKGHPTTRLLAVTVIK